MSTIDFIVPSAYIPSIAALTAAWSSVSSFRMAIPIGAGSIARSALARRREEVVREASELLASVLGEPLIATAVAGVRERLARALGEPSS